MAENALVDLGKLSKPATKLIEKVSDAVGGIAKPWQIERVAKAEVNADVIRAEGRVKISEIEERALERMVREEGKRQENIEDITAEATKHLKENAKPENVDNDWISNFFDKARLTSDDQMQQLWAKVLAGEANNPGKFTKKTVELVSQIEKSDAEMFAKLCTTVWMIGVPTAIIFDEQHETTQNIGHSFDSLSHLDDLGFITFGSVGGFMRTNLPNSFNIVYFGAVVGIEINGNAPYQLSTGRVKLSKVGEQLASISHTKPSKEYLDYVLNHWIDMGVSVSCHISSREKLTSFEP